MHDNAGVLKSDVACSMLGADWSGSKEPCVRWGSKSRMGMSNFGGFSAYRKALAVCMCCSSRDHTILNKGMTA